MEQIFSQRRIASDRGLHQKLLISHLSIAAMGAAMLMVAAVGTFWLRSDAVSLATRTAPTVQAASQALAGVQRSLANMRGWVTLGDTSFIQGRRAAWDDDIQPAIDTLSRLKSGESGVGTDYRLSHLVSQLRELQEWQWAIEDIAQTPGNQPARVIFNDNIQPLISSLFAASTALIEMEKERQDAAVIDSQFANMADFRGFFSRSSALLQEFVQTGLGLTVLEWHKDINLARQRLDDISAQQHGLTPDQNEQLQWINRQFLIYRSQSAAAIAARQARDWNVARLWLATEAVPRADNIVDTLTRVVNQQVERMHQESLTITEVGTTTLWLLGFLFLSMAFGAHTFAVRSARRITEPVTALVAASKTLAQGELDEDILVSGGGELGELAQSFNQMRRSLQLSAAHLEIQSNHRRQLAELNDCMLGVLSLQQLANKILSLLTSAFNAQTSAMYFVNDKTGRLDCIGSYALADISQTTPASIALGQGLLGQALVEKEPLVLTDIPADYLTIGSSLGESRPGSILVWPLFFEGEVIAGIEMGAFDRFTESQMEFVKLASKSISIGLMATMANTTTQDLLQETQQQADQLQQRRDELKAANQNLEQQTYQLRQSEEELTQQSEELRVINEELAQKQNALAEKGEQLVQANDALEARAKELELASKYKSEFLANMSHELRTPLNSLLILAEMLSKNESGNLTEEQVADANIIQQGGKDLLTLINDIMDLSKVEAGMLTLQFEDLRLAGFIEGLQRLFTPLANSKALDFNVSLAPDLPEFIHSDGQRLEQILKNFLSNAIKFTKQGSVSLAVAFADRDSQPQNAIISDKFLAFSVTDTGIGIAPGKQQLIFNAFQQADGSTNREYGGTGLGLTISTELAHLIGGDISVTSAEGKGSCFTLILPMAAVEPAPAQAKAPASIPEVNAVAGLEQLALSTRPASPQFIADDTNTTQSGDKAVLIIEDDPSFAEILLKSARKNGFNGLVTNKGRDGLYLAMHYQPSGILLDIGLPDIDGLQVLEQLKFNLKTRHIPVHILSAGDQQQSSLYRGALSYLAKPVKEEHIQSVFNSFVNIDSDQTHLVLVVEDDANNQQAMERLIQLPGVSLRFAGTGQQAIDLLSENTFHCVILDLGLPDMSGYQVLEKMNAMALPRVPPVIVYTGQEISDEQQLSLGKFAADIIVKGAESSERLLDDVSLFLHSVYSNLPAEQQESIQSLHDQDAMFTGRKILVVDDDMRNLYALSRQLEPLGLVVAIADNGKAALDLIGLGEAGEASDDTPFELIIMDIMMPEMDGYEAIKRIRRLKDYAKVPIIALTAKAMPGDKEKCIEAGASEYMSKPLDMEKLLSMLRVWLYQPGNLSNEG